MKKILLICSLSIIFISYSCTSSKDTTSTDKISAPAKTSAPKKDARGNYLE